MDIEDQFPYYRIQTFQCVLNGMEIKVASKPGLPHWNMITTAEQLLAGAIGPHRNQPMLLLGCGNGALGVALARQNGGIGLQMMDANWIALRVARKTLSLNGFPQVPVMQLTYPLPGNHFSTILINLPKGRKLVRRWLCEAFEALQPDGELYLAGANSEGIQSVTKDASDLFGNATVQAYRKGSRLVRMVKNSISEDHLASPLPDWAASPGVRNGSWLEFDARVCDETLKIRSLPGVFSFDSVDEGTSHLLAQLTRQYVQDRRVLDFGCGYGLIGMAAARLGAAWVDLIDVDLAAVAAAQENLSQNGIPNAQVLASDGLEAVATQSYDRILSNPPFHAGAEVAYDVARTMIAHARQILNQDGRLLLVANRFIRYDRLMMEIFGNVKRLVETGKFHVLESVR